MARTYRPLQMHQIAYTGLTDCQVAQALRPLAAGRLKVVTDEGAVLEYTFRTGRELELVENGGKQ